MKIVGISGRKQSGKNTVANIMNGVILKQRGLITDYKINDKGQLLIRTVDSNLIEGWGILDVTRKDSAFVEYAENELWPFVKIYHFADYLKKMCVDLFDLSPQQVYGTDDDKNTMTQYGKTAREFLQYFGTDVMRKIKDTVWVDCTLKNIISEQSELAIIPDVRFPNEVKAIQEFGGVVIRLDRDAFSDSHPCESALDIDKFDWDMFDVIIENGKTDIKKLESDIKTIQHFWSN